MDSDEEIEQFYKNWLALNQPNNSVQIPSPQNEDSVEDLSHIIYENDLFQLYIEKGKKNIL
jgi:hypothetical protein